MKIGLTRKQAECLAFIRSYIMENGIPPSYDEMKDGLGLRSKSGIHRLVHALAERGHITILKDRKRSISLAPDYRALLRELAVNVLAGRLATDLANRALISMGDA